MIIEFRDFYYRFKPNIKEAEAVATTILANYIRYQGWYIPIDHFDNLEKKVIYKDETYLNLKATATASFENMYLDNNFYFGFDGKLKTKGKGKIYRPDEYRISNEGYFIMSEVAETGDTISEITLGRRFSCIYDLERAEDYILLGGF